MFFGKVKPSTGPLSGLQYDGAPTSLIPFQFPKMFIDLLRERRWFELYGISYDMLMEMSYHEFVLLCEKLPTPLPPAPTVQGQTDLNKLLLALLHNNAPGKRTR